MGSCKTTHPAGSVARPAGATRPATRAVPTRFGIMIIFTDSQREAQASRKEEYEWLNNPST